MDLLDKIGSLTDDQLQMVAGRDDASGVLADYMLATRRGLPMPDRECVVLGDGYVIVAQGGEIRRVDTSVTKIIRHEGDEYCVYSEDGTRGFGCYPSLAEAEARLQQIHSFAENELAKESFTPPEGVQEAAQRALDWIEEGHAGSGFTDVGRARAAQLARGDNVSEETLRRMNSYFARHEVDSQAEGWNLGEDGFPSAGRVAWDAWGGDPGRSWAATMMDRLTPKQVGKASFMRKAEDHRFTLGPLYVPDFMDAHGEWTDANELQQAVWEWVRGGDRRIYLQHDTDTVAGEWVEVMTMPQSWTVTMQAPDGSPLGDVTYPPNTVFLGVVWNENIWPDIKAGNIRGYSIGGYSDRVLVDMPDGAMREGTEME